MKAIAETNQARFEWWVQTEFKVLPTDPKYQALTQMQLDLMYEHYLLDNPPVEEETKPANDPTYKEDEPEQYDDPDFKHVWDNMDDDKAVHGEEVKKKDEFEEV
jgi:hypothetical protein